MKFCIIIFIRFKSHPTFSSGQTRVASMCGAHCVYASVHDLHIINFRGESYIVCMHMCTVCIICISSTLEVMGGIICLLPHPTVSQSNCHPTAHQASELGGHLKLQCNDRRSFGVRLILLIRKPLTMKTSFVTKQICHSCKWEVFVCFEVMTFVHLIQKLQIIKTSIVATQLVSEI